MPDPTHDVDHLRSELARLSTENEQLRQMLTGSLVGPEHFPASPSVQAQAARVGLDPAELKRRRHKARLIMIALFATALGLGVYMGRIAGRDARAGFDENFDPRPNAVDVRVGPAPEVAPAPAGPAAPSALAPEVPEPPAPPSPNGATATP